MSPRLDASFSEGNTRGPSLSLGEKGSITTEIWVDGAGVVLGALLGNREGSADGKILGTWEGIEVGPSLGPKDGRCEGRMDGS